eukprot:CAMPEP_0117447114 /NCGR_PEP_ID=MMETSP0759-20121206/6701_1 /TAXON_ID=63605 /ORGANISM="Percolomonas cosmopolitus, Strain WS" /LENGTH=225 /DNA_ID=CAMNT_0005239425 /DNA_START=145 /DNA_END=822 /DNA_ORIENTATION=+
MSSTEKHTQECYRLWRIRRTVLQMLQDRGYTVLNEELNMPVDEFYEKMATTPSEPKTPINRTRLMYMGSKRANPEDVIMVYFPEEEKIGLKEIKNLYVSMQQSNAKRAILVLRPSQRHSTTKTISSQAMNAIDALEAKKYIIEPFKEDELLVNITHHELVPQHVPLSEEDKVNLLQKYKLRDAQLPRMKRNDPVARYFGMKRGQVCKIIRPSETAGRYVTYRLVV